MPVSLPVRICRLMVCALLSFFTIAVTASAQIGVEIIERHRADLQRQSTDPEMKRERGTMPQDWIFALPEGVRSRQITFYSDGTPCYGRIFYPKGFNPRGRWPAVVVGHGINAQAVGIEKYAARFAERGLVALAIDYRTYGYSGGDVLMLEPDTTTDERAVWEKEARIQIKRTNLNNFREAEDFRAAISWLQAEPGVDPNRIGIWGSSNGASVVLMVAALDARVKAVVAQVGGAGGVGASGPAAISQRLLEDGINRARTGQGAEVDGGFSFRSKIDLWSSQVNREFRPGMMIDRIPESTRILWIPVEKDELIPARGVQAASRAFRGTSQVIEVPYLTHFQIYSHTGFEVSSNLAADWFLTYLQGNASNGATAAREITASPRRTLPAPRRQSQPVTMPDGVTVRDVHFYSEGIRCSGRLYLPKEFSSGGRTPAVVLAPDWGETASSVERYAALFAGQGLAAMALDYRGWGGSGGFPQVLDEVKTDDRLRFSQMTARVRIRRKRLVPQFQIADIRNALYFLQDEPGIDRDRLGVWGIGMSGGHAVVIAAIDARIKAVVAQSPQLPGRQAPKKAFAPAGILLQTAIKQARTGPSSNELESRLAMAEYHPFHEIEQIPQTTAVMFIISEKGTATGAGADVVAASKMLKGKISLVAIPLAGASSDKSALAAAEWFRENLRLK